MRREEKGLMKGFSGDSAILKECGIIGLLKGYICRGVQMTTFSNSTTEIVD